MALVVTSNYFSNPWKEKPNTKFCSMIRLISSISPGITSNRFMEEWRAHLVMFGEKVTGEA
jgi:hypothetical protein